MEGSVIVHEEEEADVCSGVDPHEDEVDFATTAEVREAIELLSSVDLRRLRMAAAHCLAGSDYAKSDDLINEATRRTMDAAEGLKGRRWPRSVPFMAYMVNTMKGLASDSRGSAKRRDTQSMEVLAPEGFSAEEALGALLQRGRRQTGLDTALVDRQEAEEIASAEERDLAAIDAHFASDEQIQYLIMGLKDGMKPAEVLDVSGMTQTQYDTAKRRFRRGLDKLFPGRRK